MSKSDELDFITDVMNQKRKDNEIKNRSSNIYIDSDIDKKTIVNNDFYKIGPKKIHKNITLDEDLVKWINKKSKEYNLNFSMTVNQILLFSYENNKNNEKK